MKKIYFIIIGVIIFSCKNYKNEPLDILTSEQEIEKVTFSTKMTFDSISMNNFKLIEKEIKEKWMNRIYNDELVRSRLYTISYYSKQSNIQDILVHTLCSQADDFNKCFLITTDKFYNLIDLKEIATVYDHFWEDSLLYAEIEGFVETNKISDSVYLKKIREEIKYEYNNSNDSIKIIEKDIKLVIRNNGLIEEIISKSITKSYLYEN